MSLTDIKRHQKNQFEVDNEIEILSSLQHDNIVQYFTHFQDESSLYIEMEYADGLVYSRF